MNKTVEQLTAEREYHHNVREQMEEMLAAELTRCHLETDYTRRLRNSVSFHGQRIRSLCRTLRALKVAL